MGPQLQRLATCSLKDENRVTEPGPLNSDCSQHLCASNWHGIQVFKNSQYSYFWNHFQPSLTVNLWRFDVLKFKLLWQMQIYIHTYIGKAVVFPVVMHRYESWTIKRAEHQRIDAFELWCWRRLLRVPWTARRFNQSILKEISPEYSLEGRMLKLKLQYFGHLMWRADSLEKTLMLAKTEGRRRRGRQRMRWLDGVIDSTDMSFSKLNW